MLVLVLQLVVLAVALVVVLSILHVALAQRYYFIVMIDRGKPRVTKGKVHAAFLDKFARFAKSTGSLPAGSAASGKASRSRCAFPATSHTAANSACGTSGSILDRLETDDTMNMSEPAAPAHIPRYGT
jgi:hypothetical protein